MNPLKDQIEADLNRAVANTKVMDAAAKALGLPTLAESLKPVVDPPLCRFGPGGEFVRDYTPKAKGE